MNLQPKFKQTEIGMIPEDWDFDKLVNHAKIIAGQSPESTYYNSLGEGMPFLQGIRTFGNLYPTYDTWTTKITKLAKEDSVLLSVRAPVGEVNIADKDICIGRGLMSIQGEDNRFIYYLFKAFNDYVINKEKGTVYGSITLEDVKRIKFPFPTLAEQRAIAAILSDLDEKIELNHKMNKTLEAIGQAIFKQWFVDFEFPNEKGKPYKSSGGEMEDSELGDIPKGWRVGRFEDIASDKKNAIVDGPFGTQLHSAEYKSEGIPVIRIINLSFDGRFIGNDLVFIDEEKFNELKRSATYPGDILLAKTGATIGKFSILPFYIDKAIVASSVLKITPKNNRYYLYNIIKNFSEQDYWARISAGSTRSTINLDDVKKIEIITSPQKIVEKYELLMEKFYSLIETTEIQNLTLSQIRDALLPKLISGKIRVPLEDKE
jgi:type I restriction enzyme S subunit